MRLDRQPGQRPIRLRPIRLDSVPPIGETRHFISDMTATTPARAAALPNVAVRLSLLVLLLGILPGGFAV